MLTFPSMKSMDEVCKILIIVTISLLILTSVGFIPDTETDMTGPPASIVKVVDEDVGRVNLTVGLMGSIFGEIEIDFKVFNNRSFTATDGTMLKR